MIRQIYIGTPNKITVNTNLPNHFLSIRKPKYKRTTYNASELYKQMYDNKVSIKDIDDE